MWIPRALCVRTDKEQVMKRVSVVAVLIGAMAIGVLAQSRPDFSGTWEMDVERTRAENRARSAAASGPTAGAARGGMGGGAISGGGGGGTMSAVGASGAGGPAPAVTAVKVTQTASSLTIDRISGQVWEKVVHKLDGSESTNINGNSTMKLKSHWEGARLISEGTSETRLSDGSGSFTSAVKEVRWMEKPGVMVMESTRTMTGNTSGAQVSNAGKPSTSIQYFVKK
jgi:hypothetical protein